MSRAQLQHNPIRLALPQSMARVEFGAPPRSQTPPCCQKLKRSCAVLTLERQNQRLGQVVAEGGQEHVFRGLRIQPILVRPCVSHNIGILRPPLDSAFRTFVEAIPESNGSLEDALRVSRTLGQPAWIEPTGERRTGR